MKKWIKAIAVFLPFVLGIFSVNLYADPANLFNRDYENAAANIILSGENAAALANMDDRAFIARCLEGIDYPLDTLVLGSSRSMQISRQLTGEENQFTAGVTGGDLRDVISFYLYACQLGKQPERVILVTEPWFLAKSGIDNRARIDEYVAFAEEAGTTPIKDHVSFWGKAKELFSIPYFQSSVNFLKQGLQHHRTPVATTAYWAESDMRRADGSYCYNLAYRDPGQAVVDQRAADLTVVPMEKLQWFEGMEENCMAQFEAIVRRMQADGTEVILMIAPFHPDYYDWLVTAPDYQDVLATEDYYKETAERLGVFCFGSYDAASLGLTGADFYDGLHHSAEGLEKFFPAGLKH